MKLPLKITRNTESYTVRDADGRLLSATYFDDDQVRRERQGRLTEDEAREVAKVIARALTAAAG